jgi:NADH dehydrogenase/NADH:ubiquinone oxidoreductase subunit G
VESASPAAKASDRWTGFSRELQREGERRATSTRSRNSPNTAGAKKLGIGDNLKKIGDGINSKEITGVLFLGCEIFDSGLPDTLIKDLKKAKFSAVFTDRLTPEMKKSVDIVIPAPHWSQKSGTFINSEGISQKIEAAVKPARGVLPLTKTFADLGAELNQTSVDYDKFEKEVEKRVG